jgi:hypothetical protein
MLGVQNRQWKDRYSSTLTTRSTSCRLAIRKKKPSQPYLRKALIAVTCCKQYGPFNLYILGYTVPKNFAHVNPLPGCDIFPQLQPIWACQIRRFSASHTECAIPAIDLALYVAPVVQFLVFLLSLIILSEVVLALHKVVVALATCAHTHALLVSRE